MRRLPRPRSRGFSAMLGMALLAWTMLVSGALAMPLTMAGAMPMMTAQPTASHCDDMSMRLGASQQMPMAPMGHGDCCHGTCHCMSACNIVLTVPPLLAMALMQSQVLPTADPAGPVPVASTPPLRPPIT